jgi:hypothetical protein
MYTTTRQPTTKGEHSGKLVRECLRNVARSREMLELE